jgi:hypothetical protein
MFNNFWIIVLGSVDCWGLVMGVNVLGGWVGVECVCFFYGFMGRLNMKFFVLDVLNLGIVSD